MLKATRSLVAPLLLAVSTSAVGGVIDVLEVRDWQNPGDGLISYDKNTNLEWLDLTATRTATYKSLTGSDNQCNTECTIGPFEGWTFANLNEVVKFIEGVGLRFSGNDPNDDGSETKAFIELIGATRINEPHDQYGRELLSYGITRTPWDSISVRSVYARYQEPTSRHSGGYGVSVQNGTLGIDSPLRWYGAWMYREATPNIPEPTTLALLGLGALGLGAVRKKTS